MTRKESGQIEGRRRREVGFGIVNREAWERVKRFEVGEDSDHKPLLVMLENKFDRKVNGDKERIEVQDWSKEGKMEFRKKIRRGGVGKYGGRRRMEGVSKAS